LASSTFLASSGFKNHIRQRLSYWRLPAPSQECSESGLSLVLERALRTLVVGNFAVVTLWSWPIYSRFLVAKDFSRYVDRIVPTAPVPR
jgi:hypothetical protein